MRMGSIDLGAPRIALMLEWPLAHVRIDTAVARRDGAGVQRAKGRVSVAGDARIDEDRDGLILSDFTVELPGNKLELAIPARIHLRLAETVFEPFVLAGEGGGIRFAGTLTNATRTEPARVDAAVVLSKLDLSRLPPFALPRDFHLKGQLDLNAVVQGRVAAPNVDLALTLKEGAVERFHGIAARAKVHVQGGRARAEGNVSLPAGAQLDFHADAPLEELAEAPSAAPFKLGLALHGLDLGKAAQLAGSKALVDARLGGLLEVRVDAGGTLRDPRAVLSLEATHLSATRIQGAALKAGLLLDDGRAVLDGQLLLAGVPVVSLTGRAPFDLIRALREKAYLKAVLVRPFSAQLGIADLELERLVAAGLLPLGSTGTVQALLKLAGTPRDPTLSFRASGSSLSAGKLHDLSFQTALDIDNHVHLTAGAQGAGQPILNADATVELAAPELIELARNAMAARAQIKAGGGNSGAQLIGDKKLDALLDRKLEVHLAVPGLLLGRAALVAGEKTSFAEGRLTGTVDVNGTPAAPVVSGKLQLRNLAAQEKKLGDADLDLEGSSQGLALNLDLDPPGGGSLRAGAKLTAPLGARALLRGGKASLMGGELSANILAKKLDLNFLSGFAPNLRRTGGVLDANVSVQGLLGHPQSTGEAHLRHGVFDLVGQGIFEDVAFDATFAPRQVVLDKLTGSIGGGTFSTVLTLSQKPSAPDGTPAPIDFTGQAHLGDDQSVAGRKDAKGKQLDAGPVPLRQAGEERADLEGQIDLSGSYNAGLLSATLKIPEARLDVRKLPDKKLPGLSPNPDVLLLHPGEKPHPPGREPEDVEAENKARKASTFRLHLDLKLETLFVKAEDFDFKVHSDMSFDYDAQHPNQPRADGTITVPSGSFTALGRRFEILNAKITETGGDLTDPDLDIKAHFENTQAAVTVNVTGSAKEPQIDLSSNPPMDQDAIAFFLATGRMQGRATQSGGGVDLSSAATSVVGGLLFGQLRKTLADVLPVDVLTIETSQGGVSQASVGKYIGDRIYIGYRQRIIPAPGENTSEGHLEYEISRSVSAEATVGDQNQDVSIIYTKDF